MDTDQPTDRELLLQGDAAAFAVFYDRHAEWVLGFLRRRSPDAEEAADLTAEVFAAALGGRRRYRSEGDLPTEQRAAVLARVVDERDYPDIASRQGVSEAVARKRVSRGLAGLRRRWEERA